MEQNPVNVSYFLLIKFSPVPERGFLLALWNGFYHRGIERMRGLSTRRLYLNLPPFHLFFFFSKAATLESSKILGGWKG